MIRSTETSHTTRAQRGSAIARVLIFILGGTLTLCGVLLCLVSVVILLDGDLDILLLLPFTVSSTVGGIYIIYSEVQKSKAAAHLKAPEQPVAIAPQTETTAAAPQPQSSAEQVPQSTPAPEETEPAKQDDTASDAAEDVAHMVYRSDDVFASLRDLVRHDDAPGALPHQHYLATMLQAARIMTWPEAPACEGARLARTSRFWLRMGTADLDEDHYDVLITTEAALNVNQDLPDARTFGLDSPEARQASLQLMRALCDQTVTTSPLTEEGLRACYHDADAADTPQDWVVRSTISNAAECLKTPFRVVMDHRVNIDTGLVVLHIEVPRPICMALFTPDTFEQAGLARAYAFRLSVLLATHAFDASARVTRVVVNCHEHGNDQTILSLDINRDVLASLRKIARTDTIESGFPTDERIRAKFKNLWFAPVEPFVALSDHAATPERARIFPELDRRIASDAIKHTCHASRISDLGINENAARVAAWQQIYPQLGPSTEQAVSTLKAARDSASDITVAEACNRTMQALIDGQADLDNPSQLSTLFIDGSSLDVAVNRALKILNDDEHQDPAAALKILETALAPIEEMGVYLDDETSVYRYFGSVSERIHHNWTVDEGGREICLVPDAYFNAHSNASIALGMMDRNEEALEHAETCMRLAPTSTFATLRKVRILEAQSRIYEAADLIIEVLRHATTPRDAAICHYRLAYMEWKLGREDLAAACYVRSLAWDTEMSTQAREELDDLISTLPNETAPTTEQAEALLAREGIPLGCVRTDKERTLAAAVACMDDGALISARPLMAALFAMNGDDVVMDVYRSLSVSV